MSSADATSTPEEDEVDNSNNETPRKFSCFIEEPEGKFVPYARHQPPPPPERLTFLCGMKGSMPHTLKRQLRPERPNVFAMSTTTWKSPNQARRFATSTRSRALSGASVVSYATDTNTNADTNATNAATNASTTNNNAIASHESETSESNEYVLLLGGISVASISTTGCGEGLVHALDQPQRSHPFCRCTILAVSGQRAILRAVFAAKSWFALLRSLCRMGFLLSPKRDESVPPKVLTSWSMWDRWDLQGRNYCQELKRIAPIMWLKAEKGMTSIPPSWEIQYPLAGGRTVPMHSSPRRRQRCYVHTFLFSKVTGHVPGTRFISLDQDRSIVLLYEGRPMQRCLGCLLDQKDGQYKTLGNDCGIEAVFQHKSVSMVEFSNIPMSKIRDHDQTIQRSSTFVAFAKKKKASVEGFLTHMRAIGVKLQVCLPNYTDQVHDKEKAKGHDHLLEVMQELDLDIGKCYEHHEKMILDSSERQNVG